MVSVPASSQFDLLVAVVVVWLFVLLENSLPIDSVLLIIYLVVIVMHLVVLIVVVFIVVFIILVVIIVVVIIVVVIILVVIILVAIIHLVVVMGPDAVLGLEVENGLALGDVGKHWLPTCLKYYCL